MVEQNSGQEFRDGEVEVLLNDQPLEHVVECDLKAGWAKILEIDYRTGQPVVSEPGEIATLTVKGKITLCPKAPPSVPEQTSLLDCLVTAGLTANPFHWGAPVRTGPCPSGSLRQWVVDAAPPEKEEFPVPAGEPPA